MNDNRLPLDLVTAEQTLQAATFSIRVSPPNSRQENWGTAFFFHSPANGEALALTADHCVQPLGDQSITGYYHGHEIKLAWVQEHSCEKADIAMLRLVAHPAGLEIDCLPVGYLDPSVPERLRRLFWGGRTQIAIYGYPVSGSSLTAKRIDGSIDTSLPLVLSNEPRTLVKGRIERQRFNILGSRVEGLGGLSGAAILDRELGCVIGVQGSWDYRNKKVLGTEIGELLRTAPALKPYFTPLVGSSAIPWAGVAALVQPSEQLFSVVAPLALHFRPGATATGDVLLDDPALSQAAQAAVAWIGEMMAAFSGQLGRTFRERYWGANAPYNVALFGLPTGAYANHETVQAAMALAYLARIIRNVLALELADLALPCQFPGTPILVTAGLQNGQLAHVPAAGMGARVDRVLAQLDRANEPELALLYARSQEGAVPSSLGRRVRLRAIPIDRPEDLIDALLGEALYELGRPELAAHLEMLLKDDLRRLRTAEEAVRDGEAALRGSALRRADLEEEVAVLEGQLAYLKQQVEDIRSRLQAGQEIPLPSQLLEGFLSFEEARRNQDQQPDAEAAAETDAWWSIAQTLPEWERLQEEEAVCKRLLRRLAKALNHDQPRGEKDPWFVELLAHKQDRLWLETFDGAVEPLRIDLPEAGSGWQRVAQELDRRIDRLFHLAQLRRDLGKRVQESKKTAGEYQGWQTTVLDRDVQDLKSLIATLKYDVDAAWRQLNWLAGVEPPATLTEEGG